MGQPGGCGDVDTATAQAATVVGDAVDSRRGASFQNGLDTNGFAALRIKHVVRETSDAVSLVLDVPTAEAPRFCYQAGQFLTLRVQVNGNEHRRCYSMSSSPMVGEDLRITVKRDPGGVVSNWLNDAATPGGEIHAAPPAGRFVLGDTNGDVVAFAGGSGITPIFSLIRWALASTTRAIRLFYANRSRESVIFAEALAVLADRHPDRLVIEHHLDEDSGVVHPSQIDGFVGRPDDVEVYICGPASFMDAVEATVLGAGVPADRVHLERFDVPQTPGTTVPGPATERVTIRLDRQKTTVKYRDGDTLLQTARTAGLRAPSSCEIGSCGTCMARLTEGSARMINNDVLTEDEVAEGWVLTCQSLPTSQSVTVVYEWDGREAHTMTRVAVVTGGASGMGEATCHELGRRGNKVAVLDINGEAAQRVSDELRTEGVEALGVAADVTDRAAVEEALGKVRSELGPVSILVTSAGMVGFDRFIDITPESWSRIIDVNLTGTFHCCQAALPDMIAAKWGRIVMISSSSAQRGSPRMAHYAASKGAVISLTKSLANEYASIGITVNNIPPSGIETPMQRQSQAEGHLGSDEALARRIPMGHLGTGDDIAAAVGFLCSEEAGFITGQVLGVNGGAVM